MSDQTPRRAEAGTGSGEEWFGQPRGLATLFFTEMWERFSYYGMRGLLILFMTASVANGGLEFDIAKAGMVYAMYTSFVYLANLPGGWVADRILGQRKSVLYGGIIIALGHFTMAMPALGLPELPMFYSGLVLIVIGTGMLKPNISVMVGQLYGDADARRDGGFSIFYMGINIGAFLAPLVTGALGEGISWHLGFGAAGVGMTLGLVQYVLGKRHLGDAGLHPSTSAEERVQAVRQFRLGSGIVLAVVAGIVALAGTGVIVLSAEGISNGYGILLGLIVLSLFGWLFSRSYWTNRERKQLYVIGVLFVVAALFWSFFEQAGSTLNLFAANRTDRVAPDFLQGILSGVLADGLFPASWFQSLNALFIVMLAPVFAFLWVWLSKRGKEPTSPGKFVFGLVFLGLGFAVLAVGATLSRQGVEVSPNWLIITYLLHTIGELCLSPVGLSAMTKLAPARIGSLMMGLWFLAVSVGNYMGGFFVKLYASMELPTLFGAMATFAVAMGLLLWVLVKPLRQMIERADSDGAAA